MLFSWLNLFQYLNIFSEFRYLTTLIVSCVEETQSYLSALCIMMVGFTTAYNYRNILDVDKENISFGLIFHDVFFNAFGDFSVAESNESKIDWFFFFAATLLICLIMLNLFIGILSEKLSEMLEERQKNEYI